MERTLQITERTIILKQSDDPRSERDVELYPSNPSSFVATMTPLDIKVFLGLGLASVLLSALLIMELWPSYG